MSPATSTARGSAPGYGSGAVVCSCHGAPMYWKKKLDMRAGGLWVCKVKAIEAVLRHRSRNPEVHRRAQRAYRARHPERAKAAVDRWIAEHPDRASELDRASTARRRARLAGAEHEPWTRAEVFARGNGTCHICTKPVDPTDWHVEHVIALANGGRDALDNLLPAHPRCNLRKGDREWVSTWTRRAPRVERKTSATPR